MRLTQAVETDLWNRIVQLINRGIGSISINKFHKSAPFRVTLRPADNMNLFQEKIVRRTLREEGRGHDLLEQSVGREHVVKFSFRDTLGEHANKYFIFSFRMTLSRTNLERIQ
jgi:hypothetical protein